MLITLTSSNFRSFKDTTVFSMEATKLKNLKESNVFNVGNIELLSSAVVFGANASGKSNFIKLFDKMKNIIKNNSEKKRYELKLIFFHTIYTNKQNKRNRMC